MIIFIHILINAGNISILNAFKTEMLLLTFNTSGSEHINSQLKGIKVAAYNIHSDHFIFALL